MEHGAVLVHLTAAEVDLDAAVLGLPLLLLAALLSGELLLSARPLACTTSTGREIIRLNVLEHPNEKVETLTLGQMRQAVLMQDALVGTLAIGQECLAELVDVLATLLLATLGGDCHGSTDGLPALSIADNFTANDIANPWLLPR